MSNAEIIELRLYYGTAGYFVLKIYDRIVALKVCMSLRLLPVAIYWKLTENIIKVGRGAYYYKEIETITNKLGLSCSRF
jgi:hypothetical protein